MNKWIRNLKSYNKQITDIVYTTLGKEGKGVGDEDLIIEHVMDKLPAELQKFTEKHPDESVTQTYLIAVVKTLVKDYCLSLYNEQTKTILTYINNQLKSAVFEDENIYNDARQFMLIKLYKNSCAKARQLLNKKIKETYKRKIVKNLFLDYIRHAIIPRVFPSKNAEKLGKEAEFMEKELAKGMRLRDVIEIIKDRQRAKGNKPSTDDELEDLSLKIKNKRRTNPVSYSDVEYTLHVATNNPEEQLILKEEMERRQFILETIGYEIDMLGQEEKEAIVGIYGNSLSKSKVAKHIGISTYKLDKMLSRLLTRFKELLKEQSISQSDIDELVTIVMKHHGKGFDINQFGEDIGN